MKQGVKALETIAAKQFYVFNINLIFLFLIVFCLILALAVCRRLSKRYNLYESKKDTELLRQRT
ncbi:hypothetical protein acsn021_43100 [Anaerocolumna cellulosilytica]|uniref:Uncharacterized protein n=1 Tax=Anaerocolumna cellulosilytica TaxID=433286 RepID=A0A6S6RDE3_9FIRM|nr:hypothetical protein [Anaerocolumna cellulosilytica]MBB5195268.1 hypothetical protein [Anaerocolumna cellulosilytica]BCJ96741.1 hypothetical protein acsn021_43100 [Anaerocolumna cellulosilytica]